MPKLHLKLSAFFLSFLVFFSSCSGTLISLSENDSGSLINKRLGIEYQKAPQNYLSVSIGDEYAYCRRMDLTLYDIPGNDYNDYLTTSYYDVYTSTKKPLPTDLDEFNPSKIYVCASGGESIHSLSTIEKKNDVKSLVDMYVSGEKISLDLTDALDKYTVLFSSNDYPAVYYFLTYVEMEDGYYLYDRFLNTGVLIDSTIYDSIP